MGTKTKLAAAAAVVAVLVVGSGGVASAGAATFTVDVTGVASCLPDGRAQIAWTAVVGADEPDVDDGPLEPRGARVPGASQAAVQFSGTQSGAASGPVTFDPAEVVVSASVDAFPVQSQAIGTAPGAGGVAVLVVDVLVVSVSNPDQFYTAMGRGSIELPVCPQPTSTTTAAAEPAAVTRPTFTG